MTETDLVDLSGYIAATVSFNGASHPRGDQLRYMGGVRGNPRLFPPRTRGFLYFKPEADLSPLAGGVRFRLAETASSFSKCQDLFLPSGFPWQVMLAQIAVRPYYRNIRDQLLREKLVTPEQIVHCASVFSNQGQLSPHCIFNIKQSFVVDFAGVPCLSIVGINEMRKARLSSIFLDQQGGKRFHPYEGVP